MDLNVLAPVLLTRAVVTGMLARSGGSIINVASLLAFSGAVQLGVLPKRAVYAGSKAFLVTFSQALAGEVLDARGAGSGRLPRGGALRVPLPAGHGHERRPAHGAPPVVEASLADLAAGVVVSVPGLADTDALAHLEAASHELVSVARTAELPGRYHRKAS